MKYSVTIAHLEKTYVKTGQKVNHLDKLGLMGNTGKSDGAHVHIDCVEGIRAIRNYSLTDIYNDNPKSNKQQLDYCLDDLFSSGYHITTQYLEKEYFNTYGWQHPGYDLVPTGNDWTVYWPRTFTGRVAYAGFNESYGNYIIVFFDTLDDLQIEPEEKEPVYTYGQIEDLRYIKTKPENIELLIGNHRIFDYDRPGVNGSFFWYNTNGDLYSTGILAVGNKVYRDYSNHYPEPQSVLCYYYDDTLGIEKVKHISEISKGYKWCIGGVGLYEEYCEGFTGPYADIWRKANHMTIGYDSEGYIYLVRSYNVKRIQTVTHMKKLGCVAYMGLDGGGSVQMQTPDWNRPSNPVDCRPVHCLITVLSD